MGLVGKEHQRGPIEGRSSYPGPVKDGWGCQGGAPAWLLLDWPDRLHDIGGFDSRVQLQDDPDWWDLGTGECGGRAGTMLDQIEERAVVQYWLD